MNGGWPNRIGSLCQFSYAPAVAPLPDGYIGGGGVGSVGGVDSVCV